MVIKQKKFSIPEDDIDAFRILKEKKIIDENLYKKMKSAKGMRNILAHEYGKVDDEIVYQSVKEELSCDVKSFIKEVKKCL